MQCHTVCHVSGLPGEAQALIASRRTLGAGPEDRLTTALTANPLVDAPQESAYRPSLRPTSLDTTVSPANSRKSIMTSACRPGECGVEQAEPGKKPVPGECFASGSWYNNGETVPFPLTHALPERHLQGPQGNPFLFTLLPRISPASALKPLSLHLVVIPV